jgi:hypothetical protein
MGQRHWSMWTAMTLRNHGSEKGGSSRESTLKRKNRKETVQQRVVSEEREDSFKLYR